MTTSNELSELFQQRMTIDEEAHEVLLCHRGGYHSGIDELFDMAVFENGKITAQVSRATFYPGCVQYWGTEYDGDEYYLYDDHEESHFFEDTFTEHLPHARHVGETAFDEILKERNVE